MLSLPSQRHGMGAGSGIRGTMPDPAPEKAKGPGVLTEAWTLTGVHPVHLFFNSPNRRR